MAFTEAGSAGHALRPHYEKLLSALSIPPERADAAAACPIEQLHGGRVFLLPSFLELVRHLEEEGRDYAIVFRTFGTDTKEVAEEWNLFCTGGHPLFPGMQTAEDRTIHLPDGTGCFFRDARTPAGVHLSTVNAQGVVSISHGAEACQAAIAERLSAG